MRGFLNSAPVLLSLFVGFVLFIYGISLRVRDLLCCPDVITAGGIRKENLYRFLPDDINLRYLRLVYGEEFVKNDEEPQGIYVKTIPIKALKLPDGNHLILGLIGDGGSYFFYHLFGYIPELDKFFLDGYMGLGEYVFFSPQLPKDFLTYFARKIGKGEYGGEITFAYRDGSLYRYHWRINEKYISQKLLRCLREHTDNATVCKEYWNVPLGAKMFFERPILKVDGPEYSNGIYRYRLTLRAIYSPVDPGESGSKEPLLYRCDAVTKNTLYYDPVREYIYFRPGNF
jgi:hypothetical protein